MLAALTNNSDIACALAVVGLIFGVIGIVQSRLVNLLAWGLTAISLAGVLFWWPQ